MIRTTAHFVNSQYLQWRIDLDIVILKVRQKISSHFILFLLAKETQDYQQ